MDAITPDGIKFGKNVGIMQTIHLNIQILNNTPQCQKFPHNMSNENAAEQMTDFLKVTSQYYSCRFEVSNL